MNGFVDGRRKPEKKEGMRLATPTHTRLRVIIKIIFSSSTPETCVKHHKNIKITLNEADFNFLFLSSSYLKKSISGFIMNMIWLYAEWIPSEWINKIVFYLMCLYVNKFMFIHIVLFTSDRAWQAMGTGTSVRRFNFASSVPREIYK